MIAILTVAVAGLAGAAYLRWANVRADDYSLDLAREPDGLASVLVKEWDHAGVDPGLLGEAIFYTHPPLRDRLIHAMAWKMTHAG
jgi:STE24 endopeptidase